MNLSRGWFGRVGIETVIADADDTLWFDRRYYRRFVSAVRQIVLTTGVAEPVLRAQMRPHLTREGLSEAEYASGIEIAAMELVADDLISQERIHVEAANFRNHPVEILPEAHETVTSLSERFRMVILTQGDEVQQREKLRRSSIADLPAEFICVQRKGKAILSAICAPSGKVVSIGNSVKHDITPAVELGSRAIWVNHDENDFGRNAPLPASAIEVRGWFAIKEAL